MDLQKYSFDVRHRPGNDSDALPRLPSISSCATTVDPGYNLLQAQEDDVDMQKVLQMRPHDQPRPPFFVWATKPTLCAEYSSQFDEMRVRQRPTDNRHSIISHS